MRRAGMAFVRVNVFNALWCLLWSLNTEVTCVLSTVFIVGLLMSLAQLYRRLCWTSCEEDASALNESLENIPSKTVWHRVWVDTTFTVYLAWVSLATVLNVATAIIILFRYE